MAKTSRILKISLVRVMSHQMRDTALASWLFQNISDSDLNSQLSEAAPEADSIIPGTQRVYVKTWGCSHNNSDGEYMAGQLAAYGYQIVG